MYATTARNLGTSWLRAKREQKEAAVQLVSTLFSQVTQGQVSSTEVQKPPEVDPRFEGHCLLVTLVRPDYTYHIVRALRDTGVGVTTAEADNSRGQPSPVL